MTAPLARRGLAALALTPLLALTGACGTDPEPTMDPRTELLARPSLDQALDRYRQMQRRIQADVTAVVGPRRWADQVNADGDLTGSEGNCVGAFAEQDDGRTRTLPLYGFDRAVPDAAWPRVADAIHTVLRDYGFSTEGLVVVDRPGYHEINAVEAATGATFSFGTRTNTIMQIGTGCHLPAARR